MTNRAEVTAMAEEELLQATFLPRRQSRYLGLRALGRRLCALPFRWSLPFSVVLVLIGIFAETLTFIHCTLFVDFPRDLSD